MKSPVSKTLQGQRVTLEPLSVDHAPGYFAIGQETEIWTYLRPEPFETLADAERWIDWMFTRRRDGWLTFSVFDNVSGQLAGSSSLLEPRVAHGGIEIGFTWYGKSFRRTHVNTNTKLVLLKHCFDELGAIRVQLQTDSRNERSQRAIERIGAVKEGVLRCHKIYPDGYVRDSVIYSITRHEWPSVQTRLEAMLKPKSS